ncbi:MAG: deoxyhypusine synthase family protein [Deltaproteobacteria bacterium]|uniref:Deoxyhypusine synthase family protein n=1 Tax=Candidatus Zymogenus saltonus TaxID=2844893 RepID=A0A9D8KCL1_9DELT|nr:deoxyhypusine synthase family protein [Candidatus Zymogenus saltonus]
MKRDRFEPLDTSKVKTYPLSRRESKVSIKDVCTPPVAGMTLNDYFNRLPNILAAKDLKDAVSAVAESVMGKKTVILAMGAHVIKVGLGPLIVDLMERGIVSLVALNGAGIIHDFEMAYIGHTSENVEDVIGGGEFGMAEETSKMLNAAIVDGAKEGLGLGEAVGKMIEDEKLPHRDVSIIAGGMRTGTPVTVHVAVGTDIIHMHPDASGEAIGKSSMEDFRRFAAAVATLKRGVYFNIGSAVLLPEVFLKALTLARNLGHDVDDFTAINMDFMRQYRPETNVVGRPTSKSGRGISLTGHHEIMLPLLFGGVIDAVSEGKKGSKG